MKSEDERENNEKEVKTAEAVDYDDLLSKAGEFGKYQLFLFFGTFPFYFFGAFTYFGQLFITEYSPNHWCWVPELENLTEIERRNLAVPKDENARFGYSQCTKYVANWSKVLNTGQLPNQSWPTESCSNGWEFNKTEIPYSTISSELGWVCERDSYQASAQSIFFVGSIVGGFLIGWISDRYGRLPAAIASNIVACVAGVASIFATTFVEFAICRFIVGMGYDNCMMMAYLLALEYVAPKYRTIMANLPFAIFFTTALLILPWIALACNDWKLITLATSVPLALSIFAPFIIPESPRWLLSKGRVDDTMNKLKRIAVVNNKEIPPKMIEQFKESTINSKQSLNDNLFMLVKRPILRRMFICVCLEYMCCMIVFDALVRSIGQLQFDFFLSFTVLSLTEFPSLVLISFILDLTGRKWLAAIVLSICAIFSILVAFVGAGLPSVLCAVIARFFINMACNISMQWAAEMLPTNVRGSGVAFIHICGYVATVISPFIAYLEVVSPWLTMVVIGCVSALGAILSITLPETAKIELPQTFEDAEKLIKDQKLLHMPWVKPSHTNKTGEVNPSFELN